VNVDAVQRKVISVFPPQQLKKPIATSGKMNIKPILRDI
jgi:hypothetical protein